MARITVEDCLQEGDSYFELAYASARRAREILRRGNPQVPENDDKTVVLALREVSHRLQNDIPVTPEEAESSESAASTGDDDVTQ